MPQIARFTESTSSGGGAALVLPRAKSGGVNQLGVPNLDIISTIARAQAVNTIFYQPFRTFTPITIAGFYVEISTAGGAGSTVRVGLYNAGNDWQPTTLILDAGTFDTSTTGAKSIISGSPASLAAGNYLIAVTASNATTTFNAVRGATAIAGISPTLGANKYSIEWRASQAFGALPSTGPAWTPATSSTIGLVFPVFLDWSPA